MVYFEEQNHRICFSHTSACSDTLHCCKALDLQGDLLSRFTAETHAIATKTIQLHDFAFILFNIHEYLKLKEDKKSISLLKIG